MSAINLWLEEAYRQQSGLNSSIEIGQSGEFILLSVPLLNTLSTATDEIVESSVLSHLINWVGRADLNRAKANAIGTKFFESSYPLIEKIIQDGGEFKNLKDINQGFSDFWSALAHLASTNVFWNYWDKNPEKHFPWNDLNSGSLNVLSSLFNEGGAEAVKSAFDRGLTNENITYDVLRYLSNHKALLQLAEQKLVISASDQDQLLKDWEKSGKNNAEISKLNEVLLKHFTQHLSYEDRVDYFFKSQWQMPVASWNKAVKSLKLDIEGKSFSQKMWDAFLKNTEKTELSKAPSDWINNHWPQNFEQLDVFGSPLLVSAYIKIKSLSRSRYLDDVEIYKVWENAASKLSKNQISEMILDSQINQRNNISRDVLILLNKFFPAIIEENMVKKYLSFVLMNSDCLFKNNHGLSLVLSEQDISPMWKKIFSKFWDLNDDDLQEIASPERWTDFVLAVAKITPSYALPIAPTIKHNFSRSSKVLSDEKNWIDHLVERKMWSSAVLQMDKKIEEIGIKYLNVSDENIAKQIQNQLRSAFSKMNKMELEQTTPSFMETRSSLGRRL